MPSSFPEPAINRPEFKLFTILEGGNIMSEKKKPFWAGTWAESRVNRQTAAKLGASSGTCELQEIGSRLKCEINFRIRKTISPLFPRMVFDFNNYLSVDRRLFGPFGRLGSC